MDDLKISIAAVKEALAAEPPEPGTIKKGARKVTKKVEKVTKKVTKVAKAEKASKKSEKEVDENVVTLAQLAAEAEIAPQSARVKLREANVSRPEGRWQWPVGSKALKEVRKVIGLDA